MDPLEKNLFYQNLFYFLQGKYFPPWMASFGHNLDKFWFAFREKVYTIKILINASHSRWKKRTFSAKNRVNSYTIEFFFFSRGSMRGFGLQIDWKILAKSQSRTACWQSSTEAICLSNHKVQFSISVIWQVYSFGSPYCKITDFSVKSSRQSAW